MELREKLERINARYLSEHFISEGDLKNIEKYIKVIENTRDTNIPKVGDIVRFTNKYGDFYKYAHIDRIDDNIANICEQAYVPFISIYDDNDIKFSTSGGAWQDLDITKFKYVGKEEKIFCDWGSCGACANGAIDFPAMVNVWEFKEESLYNGYSTEFYNKDYISFCDNKERTHSNYTFFGNGRAWETKEEYEIFKRTYKAVTFKGNWENQEVIFYYKENQYLITFEEWEKLDLPIDTRLCNGIIEVKVKYDDENKKIHTYRYTNSGDWGRDLKPYKLARKGAKTNEKHTYFGL